MKRVLVLCLALLLLGNIASAKTHRRVNLFAPLPDLQSVAYEDTWLVGQPRYMIPNDVLVGIGSGALVPLRGVKYKLSPVHSVVTPHTADFIEELNTDFVRLFHRPLTADSATRDAKTQARLRRHNHSAAPAYGNIVSAHEYGVAVDLSVKLKAPERQWLEWRLWYYQQSYRVHVIGEKHCLHVMVIPVMADSTGSAGGTYNPVELPQIRVPGSGRNRCPLPSLREENNV